jgi:hypothetical protein
MHLFPISHNIDMASKLLFEILFYTYEIQCVRLCQHDNNINITFSLRLPLAVEPKRPSRAILYLCELTSLNPLSTWRISISIHVFCCFFTAFKPCLDQLSYNRGRWQLVNLLAKRPARNLGYYGVMRELAFIFLTNAPTHLKGFFSLFPLRSL